jgi:hypothetical protein
MTKLCALLVLASASAAREENFVWGDWTTQLKGSAFTRGWATTTHVGGFSLVRYFCFYFLQTKMPLKPVL